MVLSSSIGGLLFGYDTGIIGGANLYVNFKKGVEVTSQEKQLIVSIAIIGALIGSLIGG